MKKIGKFKRLKRIKLILALVHIAFSFLFILGTASFLIMLGNGKEDVKYESGQTVSPEVKGYSYAVAKAASEHGIESYVRYLLAIMQVDVMQSLGNSGIPENKKTPELSIEYGVAYFADLLKRAESLNCDIDTVLQAYNYGTSYLTYVADRGGVHTYDLATSFAAQKSGGKKVIYNNPIALRTNGGWRMETCFMCI